MIKMAILDILPKKNKPNLSFRRILMDRYQPEQITITITAGQGEKKLHFHYQRILEPRWA